jgi:hypothetical protein
VVLLFYPVQEALFGLELFVKEKTKTGTQKTNITSKRNTNSTLPKKIISGLFDTIIHFENRFH